MTIPLSQRFTILERDEFTCRYCGRKAPETELEVDHVHPRSKGGSDEAANLATTCRNCNQGKGDRVLMPSGPRWDEVWGSLAGKYFLVPAEDGGIAAQGEIFAEPTPGFVVAEIHSHVDLYLSGPTTQVVAVTEIAQRGWRLYRTVDELSAGMRAATSDATRRQARKALPEVNVRVFVTLDKASDHWVWRLDRCPHCGRQHTHSGGSLDDDPREELGHRVSHCGVGKSKGYELVEAAF